MGMTSLEVLKFPLLFSQPPPGFCCVLYYNWAEAWDKVELQWCSFNSFHTRLKDGGYAVCISAADETVMQYKVRADFCESVV